MVEIGERPILWHIMKTLQPSRLQRLRRLPGLQGLRHQGVLLQLLPAQLRRDLRHGDAERWRCTRTRSSRGGSRWSTPVPTRRPAAASSGLPPTSATTTFMVTYGDGVARRGHRRPRRIPPLRTASSATVTAVQPLGRFGALRLGEDRETVCARFRRSPQATAPGSTAGSSSSSRRSSTTSPATRLCSSVSRSRASRTDGELVAFKHRGFWQPMDTLRDLRSLEQLWSSGAAPWKVW